MQIEILINSNSYQTWSLFFRPFFRLDTQSREAKKTAAKKITRKFDIGLKSIVVFFLLGFFSLCMYFVGCRLMKNKPLTEKVWRLFPYVFPSFEHKQSQMKTATTVAPNKRLHIHACFHFFAHLFAFVCKKQQSDNQKFKVWEHKHLAM